MKLTDLLLENTLEYRVKFVTIKDKDVSQGSASYKDLADAKKFFDSLTNDPEVYRAQIDKMLGADSSRDMGAMSFRGGSEEIERYSHPAIRSNKKFDELTPAEQDIRMFANSRLGTMGKKGFTSKDGTYKYLEEGLAKSAIIRQIKDAEEILDSGEADGVPLDNETEMLVQQELSRLKRMLAMNETSLEELYNQVQESRYGFFSNSEGQTAAGIMTEALDEYEATVERAFQTLINKTNTAINIEKSGGTDTEVRENLAYQFDKIQEKITTRDYLNATFYK